MWDPDTRNITDILYLVFEDGSCAFKNHYSLQWRRGGNRKEFGILRASLKLFKVHNSITVLYIAHNLWGVIIHGLEASVNIRTVSQYDVVLAASLLFLFFFFYKSILIVVDLFLLIKESEPILVGWISGYGKWVSKTCESTYCITRNIYKWLFPPSAGRISKQWGSSTDGFWRDGESTSPLLHHQHEKAMPQGSSRSADCNCSSSNISPLTKGKHSSEGKLH